MKKSIVIADDEPITRMDISEILVEAGYDVVGQALDGFDAVELCRKHKPDLVLMDVKMPLLDGLKAAKIITKEELSKCIVLLTSYSEKSIIERAKEAKVMGYLVKPINEKVLLPAIEVALAKSREIEDFKKEVQKAEEKLESRKIIDRAKAILIKNDGISEETAYNRIRKLSMDKRCPMENVAKIIIVNETFDEVI